MSLPELIEELNRRTEHPINVYKPGEAADWNQLSFHQSSARYRLIFGGNRSGKSQSSAFEIACWLRGYSPYGTVPEPPISSWVISVEYSTIWEGIYKHLERLIPDWEIRKKGATLPTQRLPSYIELKNGSVVAFKSSKGGSEAREKFQAADVDLIAIDEEITPDIWTELELRTLDRAGKFIISATLVESYDWIVELERRADEGDPNYFITRLHTEENPHLDAATVQLVKAKLSEEEVQVRFYGKSRRSTGLIYSNFTEEKNIVEPFNIPKDWPRWCAIDPGIRKFAVLWIAVGTDKCIYVYRELYLTGAQLYEAAREIKTSEGYKLDVELSAQFKHFVWDETPKSEHLIDRLIDPSAIRRSEAGEAGINEQLSDRYGLSCSLADNSFRAGIENCRHLIENGLKVFKDLVHFQYEIRRYRIRSKSIRREQSESVDLPIRAHDHLMDCFRYLANAAPTWEDREMQPNAVFTVGQLNRVIQREHSNCHDILGENW